MRVCGQRGSGGYPRNVLTRKPGSFFEREGNCLKERRRGISGEKKEEGIFIVDTEIAIPESLAFFYRGVYQHLFAQVGTRRTQKGATASGKEEKMINFELR